MADGRIVREVSVLLSSPLDAHDPVLELQRDLAGGDFSRLVRSLRPDLRVTVLNWQEDPIPGYHVAGGQGGINDTHLSDAQIVIAVFNHELGTPWTDPRPGGKTYPSGTVAEIMLAHGRGKTVRVYSMSDDVTEPLTEQLNLLRSSGFTVRRVQSTQDLIDQARKDCAHDVGRLGREEDRLPTWAWGRTRPTSSDEPPAVSPPAGSYRAATEYLTLSIADRESEVSLHANNRHKAGDRSHIPGTPTDEAWDVDDFLGELQGVVAGSVDLLCAIGGWSEGDVILGNPIIWGSHEGRRGGNWTVGFPIDTPPLDGPTTHAWGSLSALVHFRNWQFSRDIDNGWIDLYITMSKDRHALEYDPIEEDPAALAELAALSPAITRAITRMAEAMLDKLAVSLWTRGPFWDDTGLPVFGEGWSCHFSYLITSALGPDQDDRGQHTPSMPRPGASPDTTLVVSRTLSPQGSPRRSDTIENSPSNHEDTDRHLLINRVAQDMRQLMHSLLNAPEGGPC
jgi:hypothetical protein